MLGTGRSENIFNRLVTNENTFTSLLCNLFQFPVFKEKFIAHAFPGETVAFDYADIMEQQRQEDGGQPDFQIRSGDILLVFESKVNTTTALTKNQTTSYFLTLRDSCRKYRDCYMVFILPRKYRRIPEIQRGFSEICGGEAHLRLRFVHWEDVINLIEENGLDQLSLVFRHAREILADWFLEKLITFTGGEMLLLQDKNVPGMIIKLRKVTENVSREIGYKTSWHEPMSYTVKDGSNNTLLWFGVWWEIWEKHDIPFCLAVAPWFPKEILGIFSGRYPDRQEVNWEGKNWLVHPIPIRWLENQEGQGRIIQEIKDICGEYAKGKHAGNP